MSARTVRLRRYERSDTPDFIALFGDPQVMRYVGDGVPLDAATATTLMEKILRLPEADPAFFVWAVEEGAEYAGHAELKRRNGRDEYEVVYIVQRKRWRRGLGGDVCDLLVAEARDRRVPFLVGTAYPQNAASLAILRRRGFLRDEALSQELRCPAYRLRFDADLHQVAGSPTWDDVRRIALALPGASEGVTRGHATWIVNGKLFVWERPLSAADRAALGEAAPGGAILGARTADLEMKEAVIASDPRVFFTIPHFDGYPAVLVRLDAIAPVQLDALIVEAWLARAKKRDAEAYVRRART